MFWVAKYLKRSCSIVDIKLSYLLLYLLLCCFFFGLFFSFLSKLFVMCCLPYLKESYICKIKKYKVKKFADSFLNWDLLTVAYLTEIFAKFIRSTLVHKNLKRFLVFSSCLNRTHLGPDLQATMVFFLQIFSFYGDIHKKGTPHWLTQHNNSVLYNQWL